MVLVYEPQLSTRVQQISTWEIIEVVIVTRCHITEGSRVVLRAFYL